jgi:hypothetical protein
MPRGHRENRSSPRPRSPLETTKSVLQGLKPISFCSLYVAAKAATYKHPRVLIRLYSPLVFGHLMSELKLRPPQKPCSGY